MLNKKDLQILELNNQINSLKAHIASEFQQVKAEMEQLEAVVLTIARVCSVSAEDLTTGLLDEQKNKDYKDEVQIRINIK